MSSTKTKIQFLRQIDLETKDLAGNLSLKAVTTGAGSFAGGVTTFQVNSTKRYNAGDDIFLDDKSVNAGFTSISEVTDATHIKVVGDFHLIAIGALVMKTDAVQHLDKAMNVYSMFKPLERVKKTTTNIAAHVFALPDDFEIGFSEINKMEYPVDGTPPIYREKEDYEIRLADDNTYKIYFNYDISTGFRTTYFIRHSFVSNVATSPDADFNCIAQLASAYYLLAMAAFYGQSVHSSIEADSVNYDNKTDAYRRLAKVLLGHVASWLGVSEGALDGSELSSPPAGSISNYEPVSSDNLYSLTHSRRLLINNNSSR